MFIAANWKMNLDKKSIKSFVEHLKIYKFSKNVQSCIVPPIIYIQFLGIPTRYYRKVVRAPS